MMTSPLSKHNLFADELPESWRRPKLRQGRSDDSTPSPSVVRKRTVGRRRLEVIPVDSSPTIYKFSGTLDLQFAQHTTSPSTPASERAWLTLQQKAEFNSHWSGVVSGQGWFEGAYKNDAPESLHGQDSYDTRFQDTLIQYQNDDWIVRVGNQQVVWGETFGSFIADIVNPKDLRYGLPIDLSKTQLATPMLNLKYLVNHFSVQGLFIPQAYFNLLPLLGSDFSPAPPSINGFSSVAVSRETNLSFGNCEFGGRISQTLGSVDLAIFGLSYYDRTPHYELAGTPTPGKSVILNERHARVASAGQSLAWALEDYGVTLREESVFTANRTVSFITQSKTLGQLTVNNYAFASAIDFPPWRRFNFSLQWSADHLFQAADYIARNTQDVQFFAQRTQVRLFTSSSLESILSVSTIDAGVRYQLEYMTPLSSQFEFRLGTEIYTGDGSSDFGHVQRASRVYVSLKGFFRG